MHLQGGRTEIAQRDSFGDLRKPHCIKNISRQGLQTGISFGQPLSQTLTNSSANVKDASTSLGRYTCQRKNCKPSQSPGPLRSGVSTWSAPCRKRPVVTHTSSSPSTNSPSGSKPNPSPRSQPPRPRNFSKILW